MAAVVAVALVAGGVWLFGGDGGDGDGGGPGGDGKAAGDHVAGGKPAEQLFSLKQPDTHVKREDAPLAAGSWITRKIYAKTSLNAVEGHRVDGGRRAWNLPLAGPSCAASPHMTDEHVTAIAFDKGSDGCSAVAAFDVDTGEKLWEKPLAEDEFGFGGGDVNLTVADGVVAATWIGGHAAYDVTSGKKLWKDNVEETCSHARYGGGARLLAVLECGRKVSIHELDPRTGRSRWDVELPQVSDGRSVRLVDTDPVVLLLGTDGDRDEVMTVTEQGEVAASINLGNHYEPGCLLGNMGSESCANIVAVGDTVVVSRGEHSGKEGSSGDTNEAVGFDFSSGKPKWKVDAGEGRTIFPVAVEDGKVIAYRPAPVVGETAGDVVGIDPANGKERGLLRLPDSGVEKEQEFSMPSRSWTPTATYAEGRFFLQEDLLRGKDEDTKKPLALAYGPR
ncbi:MULTISPECIES: PQQ-binding-like beta-propeller repeat protein [Streptomyces]|uniref:outer membrane protein assembly factor BamB family protein n=1 Tax=Streptomyces TaxID=1883 RepID=UPI0004C95F80|nr:PQQ-binding-like beta-propeller repeat protein [Streptomyces sp. NRRL S-1868]